MGLRTLNERINQIEPLARCAHTIPITDVPPVIQLDGIWVTIQSQQETIKPDKRKRQRHLRSGKKRVVLVALGFWSDGRREVLDWQIARSEDHQEWEVLVQRLWEHGGPFKYRFLARSCGSALPSASTAFLLAFALTLTQVRRFG